MAARRSRTPRRSKAYREFLSEAEEILERLRGDLADLGEQRAEGGAVDPDLVNRLFRSAHSLKGLAGMFNLDALSELSHHLEDVLDGMRLGRVSVQSPAAALLDEAVALIAAIMEELGAPDAGGGAAARVPELVERLTGAAGAPPAPARSEFTQLDLDPSLLRALTEYEEHRLRENMQHGRRIAMLEASFEVLSFDEGLAELTREAREVGEVLSTLPSPGAAPESQIRFGLLLATDLGAAELTERIDLPNVQTRLVYEPAGGEAPSAGPPAAQPGAAEAAPPRVADGGDAEIESLKSISETVRVDIRKLDELMNLVGELVIQRSALAAIAERLAVEPATARAAGEIDKVHKTFERKLQELQGCVLDVRMVPLRQVFEKLSRVVRRLRRDLNKNVRLELRGADTELDKLIVEELIDPLVHLVRNAFDHGIELEAERRAAGKPTEGEIRIEAFQRGNHVVIVVADDGRGIDPDAVRERAEARGLIAPDEALTRKETLDLVFLPGLSLRDEVTETSGRGVGMDVVRANLAALAGVVDIESVPGRGTKIAMTLPITLAIIQALTVGVGDQRYAIPLNAILETLVLDPRQIQRSEGREMLSLRGEPLLLRRLRDEFGLGVAPPDLRAYVVVLGLGESRLGLVVDRLLGQQDTVIKPIQGPVHNIRGIAGATELGDQGAVLVLDVAAIVDDVFRRREAA